MKKRIEGRLKMGSRLAQTKPQNLDVLFDPVPIKRAMAIRGLTLSEVAERVGCSKNAVWRITNAKTWRPAYLHAVCKLLNVAVEDCYPLSESRLAGRWRELQRAAGLLSGQCAGSMSPETAK
jgi:DNA-binding Xre family transcriptional regulator